MTDHKAIPRTLGTFDGLFAIVQYRIRSNDYQSWHNMAAFDSMDVAESYAKKCEQEAFEYRAIEIVAQAAE